MYDESSLMSMKKPFIFPAFIPGMKLIPVLGLLIWSLGWQVSGRCQNITGIEYYFDTDPGYGLAAPLPVTPAPEISLTGVTISTASLSQGFHQLFFRAVDDSGRWSTTHHLPFYKTVLNALPPDITALEYFFDADPGPGMGNPVPVIPAPDQQNISFAANVSSLSNGFHFLLTRAMDASGRWSTVQSIPFFKQLYQPVLPDIIKAEYFFDTDPGYGNAVQLSFTPGTDKNISWIASIASLNQGFHQMLVRVQDSAGNWSLAQHLPFYKQQVSVQEPDIVKVEYFIDTDPGYGMGVDVAFTQDTGNLDLAFAIDIQDLSQGFHSLCIRSKDSRGKWSLVQFQPFFKQLFYDTLPDLVAVEYFYNTDPGEGNGYAVPFTPAPHIPFLAWSLDLSGQAFGQHMLYIRTRDESGNWSLYARDTIFYYLDSLPTASLSGPQGICINTGGQFEVTLTGTAPWTLHYYDGEDSLTVQGIMNSPYFFNVSPGSHGTHTARILQVQDAYYTGLYTGIPIEYQVYPLPQQAGPVSGSDNLCSGTGNAWYFINPVQHASAYQWTYPAGVTVSGTATQNSILLNFGSVTESGEIIVTPVNACGQGLSSSLYVNIRPLPQVDAGSDQNIPFNDSALMAPSVSGGSGPYSYYWNPWYMMNNPYIPDATAYTNTTTTFTLYVTDLYGCQGSDQVTVFVGLPPGTQVEGSFTYDNMLLTPLNNATVILKQGTEVIATAGTGTSGDFAISGIPAGNYFLSASSSKPWGGVNATDAMLVLQHFTSIIFLNGLRLEAADVNATGNINAIDALLIARRYAEIISSFPAGDWLSDVKTLNASGSGVISEQLRGIVYGDVNGSYVPSARLSGEIELETEGLMTAGYGERIELPVFADRDIQAGAISLEMMVPAGIRVSGVRTMRASGYKDEAEPVIWNVAGERLLIAWYSINPMAVRKGEAMLWIRLESMTENEAEWTLGENASIADGTGQTITPLYLHIPAIKTSSHGLFLEQNHPNPCSTTSTVSYCLPEEGQVSLSLKTPDGKLLRYFPQGQMPEGWHQFIVDVSTLSSGLYLYILEFEGNNYKGTRTGKLMVE